MKRTEKRRITETMDAIMMPLIIYLDEQTKEVVRQALRILRDDAAIKTLEQESKTGYWIEHEGWNDDAYSTEYSCSECNEWTHEKSNFCPNCGAKMVEK